MDKLYMQQEIRVSIFSYVCCDDPKKLLESYGIDTTKDYNVRLAHDSEHYIYTRTVSQDEVSGHAKCRVSSGISSD